jgi:hypothetical protein
MTNAELVAAINANPTALAQADAGLDNACAATISASLPPVVVSPTLVDERSLVNAFAGPGQNPADAVTLIGVIQTLASTGFPAAAPAIPADPVAGLVLSWMTPPNGGADFGNVALRTMIANLGSATVGGVPLLSPEIVATVLGLAEVPATVDHGQVSDAWLQFRPGGIVGGSS